MKLVITTVAIFFLFLICKDVVLLAFLFLVWDEGAYSWGTHNTCIIKKKKQMTWPWHCIDFAISSSNLEIQILGINTSHVRKDALDMSLIAQFWMIEISEKPYRSFKFLVWKNFSQLKSVEELTWVINSFRNIWNCINWLVQLNLPKNLSLFLCIILWCKKVSFRVTGRFRTFRLFLHLKQLRKKSCLIRRIFVWKHLTNKTKNEVYSLLTFDIRDQHFKAYNLFLLKLTSHSNPIPRMPLFSCNTH